MAGNVTEAELPALVDRYWPVVAAEISAGLRDEDGRLLPHSTQVGVAAWEAWLDEHPEQRKPIGR